MPKNLITLCVDDLRYTLNATSHLRVLHTQVHNLLLARESTHTSKLDN